MIDDNPIVDGVVTTVNEFNDIIVPAAWDGKRHVVTFKTRSAQYFSSETLRFQFWQSYDSTGYHSYPISCICMPKIEEGQAATAYLPHEDDLVGDSGTPGATGHTGRFFYYAGVYDSSKIYRIEESQAPYVMFSGLDDKNVMKTGFFMLDYKGDEPPYINWPGDGHPAAPSFKTSGLVQWNPWTLMSSENQYYIAKAFFGENAYLGSFIINGDWMISQYGTLVDSSGTKTIVNADNVDTLYNGKVPYVWFDPTDPVANTAPSSGQYKFAPNYAVDGKTGDSIQGKGYFRGEIYATNGEFSGVVRVKALYQDWQSPNATTQGVYPINPDLGTGIYLASDVVSFAPKTYYLPETNNYPWVSLTLLHMVAEIPRNYVGPPKVSASGNDRILVKTQQGTTQAGYLYTVKGLRAPINRLIRLHAVANGLWVLEGDETGMKFFNS